jgi:hypothetical protein
LALSIPALKYGDFRAFFIKKYAPYKNDVDQILQGLEYNKAQMKQISKKLNKQAEEETNK